ncbi:hypothetical protein BDL97_11G057600 [Sphagnum fallax]|nr:hypothetical protein BDL97_11G057200 [Sphagnum fallax]KAH8947720.1 hypothetical protein BDL97_11G057600 [Sphagnum fallax]
MAICKSWMWLRGAVRSSVPKVLQGSGDFNLLGKRSARDLTHKGFCLARVFLMFPNQRCHEIDCAVKAIPGNIELAAVQLD